ncbi:MAG: prevent-host-death protein [Proteobacteria bacterium]|nr:prevent-host-death protein [Pseudomonadota bacterium]
MRETNEVELRSHTKDVLDAVEHGATIRIYRKGVAVADMVPVPQKIPSWKEVPERLSISGRLISEEILKDREGSP